LAYEFLDELADVDEVDDIGALSSQVAQAEP